TCPTSHRRVSGRTSSPCSQEYKRSARTDTPLLPLRVLLIAPPSLLALHSRPAARRIQFACPPAGAVPMIRPATAEDTSTICRLIRGLAEYERLAHAVALDEERLRAHLFGPRPFAEVLLAEEAGAVVGFALFFHNYST